MWTREERQEAIFGSFDGVVSVIGVIFGCLVAHQSAHTTAIVGTGAAIAAAVSMGMGEVEKGDEPWHARLPIGITMFVASALGSLVPVWPFYIFSKSVALLVAGVGCLLVATWIGFEKRKGISGYTSAYLAVLIAGALTLGIVSLIPGAG
jgi:VIT1/CCC1 family predicted Fe2+/Mn2+ transporter